MLKQFLILIFLTPLILSARAQKVDSIYFHLYTDSLKKGTYNYINVDGKFSDGHWLPLTSKDINFSSTGGTFVGNNLFIDSNFIGEKVTIKAVLKQNPALNKEVTIYIKKKMADAKLKTVDELLNEWDKKKKNKEKVKKKTALQPEAPH